MGKKTASTFGQLDFFAKIDDTPLDTSILRNNHPEIEVFIRDWGQSKFFALDIETMGCVLQLEALDPFRGKIRLIQIGLPDGRVAVIDMTEALPVGFLKTLHKTLSNKDQHPIGHNIQFDLAFIQQQYGIECVSPRCTRILSILLWCGIKIYGHSLGDVYERLFGEKLDKQWGASDWSQPELSNSQINYAAEDVRATLKCFYELCKRIKKLDNIPDLFGNPCRYKLSDIAQIECDAIPAFVELNLNGQPIDIDYGLEVRSQYESAIADLYQPVFEALDLPFTASPDKLCIAIWEQLDILLKKEVKDFDKDEDKDNTVKVKQLSLFNKKPINLADNEELSSSSANLFFYYCETKNELLLRLSLTRSLKKCIDAIDLLINSAIQNDGYAKGSYTSLGSTGSGRSTCSSGNSTLIATNLQNIPNLVEHPLLDKYNLPAVRAIIKPKEPKGMFLVDIASSHLRLAARNSGDSRLVEILSLPDAHALVTSKMMELGGIKRGIEYCTQYRKKDPQVAYYRQIAKTATYTQFNDGKAWTFKQSLNKAFVDVSLEDCELAQEALAEAFPGYTDYADRMHRQLDEVAETIKIGNYTFKRFKTHDGRIFHIGCYKATDKWGREYTKFKLGEATSANLISPEAITMKQVLAVVKEVIRKHRYQSNGKKQELFKLNSFSHDDISGEDYTEGKVFTKVVYTAIYKYFNQALDGLDSGMKLEDWESVLINNYSEK